jgi:hypothetical protein
LATASGLMIDRVRSIAIMKNSNKKKGLKQN